MKILSVTIAILSLIFGSCHTNAQQKINKMENVQLFVSRFHQYRMDIEGAGLATIPNATITDRSDLYIEYAYFSDGENRKGKMTLTERANHRYEGTWKTIADNGNVYEGTLYFTFKENGEAAGRYTFAGSDYKIRIFIPAKN